VARLLEADAGASRHHQRRRHCRVLPEQVSAPPSRGVPRRSRSLRPAHQGGARRRDLRDGADGFQSHAEDFFKTHPDWFARDVNGQPYRAADKYIACINSPYYDEYLPDVLREIIERSRPDGFTDNSWAGLGRESICYCANCTSKFKAKTGKALPPKADWNDQAYRDWIMWSYARRTEVWEMNNRTTRAPAAPTASGRA
jgi:hypothetical protein